MYRILDTFFIFVYAVGNMYRVLPLCVPNLFFFFCLHACTARMSICLLMRVLIVLLYRLLFRPT